MAAKREASLGPNLVERAASNVAGAASTAGSMAMRVLGGLGFVAMLAPLGIALGRRGARVDRAQSGRGGQRVRYQIPRTLPSLSAVPQDVADATTNLKVIPDAGRPGSACDSGRGTTPRPARALAESARQLETGTAIEKAATALGLQMGEATVKGLQQGVAFSAQGLDREFSDTLGSVVPPGPMTRRSGGGAAGRQKRPRPRSA